MITDYNATVKFIRTLAQSAGLSLVFEDASMPRTDGRTIWVPAPSLNWSEQDYIGWQFYIYHEIGHNYPETRDCFAWAEKTGISPSTPYGFLMNLLEDYRSEKFKHDEYEAKQIIMSKGRRIHTLPQLKGLGNDTQDKLGQIIKSLWLFDLNCREDWMSDLIGLSDANKSALDAPTRNYYEKLIAGGYVGGLNAAISSDKIEKFIDKLLREVYDEDPEEWKKKARQLTKQQNAAGKGKYGKQKSKNSKGSGETAQTGKEKGKTGDNETDGGVTKYEDLLAHYHAEEGRNVTFSGEGLRIDYSSYNDRKAYTPASSYNIVDKFNSPQSSKAAQVLHGDVSTIMAGKVRRLLQIKSQAITLTNQKKGKLHPKNLYKVVSPDKDRRERVYKQKTWSDILNVSVTVLVDTSGSMSGQKYLNACKSAVCLNEAISKIGVPLELIGFTEDAKITHYIYKEFMDRISNTEFASKLTDSQVRMGGNADGESILYAYERLKKQRTKRKILIVLSDGQPAGGEGDIYTYTKDIVKYIETKTDVEIYGIGIQSDTVKSIYKDCKVINKPQELEATILTLIKDKIIGV